MKIRSSATGRGTLNSDSGVRQPQGRVLTHPMSILLFGKRAPRFVDRRKYGKHKKGLRLLTDMKDHIALLLGRRETDFEMALCEGDNAFISRDGQIAFGVELLEAHAGEDDLLLGILGHEMGHQPWTWPSTDLSHLSPNQLKALYREEEAKADRFAGRVLADLGGNPRPMLDFLNHSAHGFEQAQESSDYYPVAQRIDMIQKSFERRQRLLKNAHKLING